MTKLQEIVEKNKDFSKALNEWLIRAQKIAGKNQLTIDPNGKKYLRIVRTTYGNRSVHCFIEKSTGFVLMAASWKAPAKHPRGNIFDIGQEGVGEYGANYLR